MSDAAPAPGRPPEIEEISNRLLIHPVARALTPRLARLGVSPNAVSLAGMACGLGAGLAYHAVGRPGLALAGFALMLAWHLMDGIDGQLARLTGTHSEFGKLLDGVCDYATFGAVYLGLGTALAARHGPAVWLLVALAALSHVAQSAAYEAQRQDYLYHGWGRGRPVGRAPAPHGRAGSSRAVALALAVYERVQGLAAGAAPGADASEPASPAARARFRDALAPSLRRWAILSANTHTVAILLFALPGVPLLYFVFEATVLNLALLALLRERGRIAARLVTPAPA